MESFCMSRSMQVWKGFRAVLHFRKYGYLKKSDFHNRRDSESNQRLNEISCNMSVPALKTYTKVANQVCGKNTEKLFYSFFFFQIIGMVNIHYYDKCIVVAFIITQIFNFVQIVLHFIISEFNVESLFDILILHNADSVWCFLKVSSLR